MRQAGRWDPEFNRVRAGRPFYEFSEDVEASAAASLLPRRFGVDGIILFYDITTLIREPAAFREAIDLMTEPFRDMGIEIVVGMESRGFIFSAPMAYELGAGLVPVRKLGKLPAETLSVEYALEYGSNTLEIHRDAIEPGQKVLIVDDLLATKIRGTPLEGRVEVVAKIEGESEKRLLTGFKLG